MKFNIDEGKIYLIKENSPILSVSVFEDLSKLGYVKDIKGNPIETDNQVIEIKPQDLILPDCDDAAVSLKAVIVDHLKAQGVDITDLDYSAGQENPFYPEILQPGEKVLPL